MDRLVLWLAQGFAIGRVPWMPGTFGSALGLLWVAVLLATQNAWCYFAGTVAGLFCSVWFCGEAERILGQTDPGSVVLDEVVAMPLCCAGWLFLTQDGVSAGPAVLYANGNWLWTIAIFLTFRVFDILKPWPLRQSQALSGGWGVTADDALAAGYVNVTVLGAWGLVAWWKG